MSSSLRRGTLAATVLALSAATLTACAAGNDAETNNIRPDNAAASVGDIKVQAVNIVTTEGGTGPAAVTGTIFNAGDKAQTLREIRLDGTNLQVQLTPAKGESLEVPAGGELALGGKGNASAVILEGASDIEAGSATALTFDLSSTGTIKLRATVVPAEHDGYEKFGPTVKPTEPAEPTEASPSGSPEESGTPEGEEGEGEADAGASPDATDTATPDDSAQEESGDESQEQEQEQQAGTEGADAGH